MRTAGAGISRLRSAAVRLRAHERPESIAMAANVIRGLIRSAGSATDVQGQVQVIP